MCDQQRLRTACAYVQYDQSICLSLEYSMTVRLLTEHHLEFLSLTGYCTGSSDSTPVKIPHCWKSHVAAQILDYFSCSPLNSTCLSLKRRLKKFEIMQRSDIMWASSIENLSLGFPTRSCSNKPAELLRLARDLKFHLQQV